MTATSSTRDVRERVRGHLPALWRTLAELVRDRSVGADPDPPLAVTAEKVAALFRGAGLPGAAVTAVTHEGRTSAPLVHADAPGPPGAPTVLLYAHYDVQPADGSKWTVTAPFEPKEVDEGDDTRLYGRGAADDKSGIVMHLGALEALRANGSDLPIGVKLVVEGEEEGGDSVLAAHVAANPGDTRFHADVVVVADTGNLAVGRPALTSTLRGALVVDVAVRTLRHEVHSGVHGGPAPDAFLTLAQILATLQDPVTGDVAVPGLGVLDHPWPEVPPEEFRRDAGVLDEVDLIGSGTIAQQLYGRPSVTVVGLAGAPSAARPANVLTPSATARISLRLAPDQDPDRAFALLRRHVLGVAPFGVRPVVTPVGRGAGVTAGGGAFQAEVEAALAAAYGTTEVAHVGQGGSIPLVAALRAANPRADLVLWGCEEPRARIHGDDESVSRSELEHMTVAEALLLHALAGHGR
ncbi:M20/M25/M40 family metallo-hydrolase [Saccharothrix australiensis]|uniref:Acetylornithine deacetylase/succinyl-diaminopimelate desuccinylase-like protein n=1 Tax=Saccharothrix australiensis TaxID=2072 RepID=A0A495W3G7_9PSEU|nr:M20/M25/M40 family metallo-hydrolase [Saccharothrix australiensis]RKT56261.1 acetylornithine deacetylase/succinyl-diaminopimelate desuccinylase-like protein [Saccharothrix australiensis]